MSRSQSSVSFLKNTALTDRPACKSLCHSKKIQCFESLLNLAKVHKSLVCLRLHSNVTMYSLKSSSAATTSEGCH